MGERKVPSGEAPYDQRIDREVPYSIWYCPKYPLSQLGGKLDKDPQDTPWLQGLYEDIQREGGLRNPIIVWNHHANRLNGKQPKWLLRAGSNRIWCCEEQGITHVPAIVTTQPPETPLMPNQKLQPREMEIHLHDPGVMWANEHGIGLLRVDKPEITYAEFTTSTLRKTDQYDKRYVTRIRHILDGTDDPRDN